MMKHDFKLMAYKKKYDYTYVYGAFPVVEALNQKADHLAKVIIHEDAQISDKYDLIKKLCEQQNVHMEINTKLVERLRQKDNCLVIGILMKYQDRIDDCAHHLMLVNPSDMGNMGTILRTCLGFGIKNVIIIEPAVDYFNPRVIRSSMGAIFNLNIRSYPDFQRYASECQSSRIYYPFMLDGAIKLENLSFNKTDTNTYIFGNEATGLDQSFAHIGQSIYIDHLNLIDSLNLSIAVGIALHYFYN